MAVTFYFNKLKNNLHILIDINLHSNELYAYIIIYYATPIKIQLTFYNSVTFSRKYNILYISIKYKKYCCRFSFGLVLYLRMIPLMQLSLKFVLIRQHTM